MCHAEEPFAFAAGARASAGDTILRVLETPCCLGPGECTS